MRTPRRSIAFFLACSLAAALPAGARPLSRAEEGKLGERVFREVASQFAIADDPYIDQALRKVADRIGAAIPDLPFPIRPFVVADPQVNAFAVPGGYVYVTTGALLAMADEEELAGVMAHEIGHVAGRHIAGRVEAQGRMQMVALAALIAGVFLGAANPDVGMAVGSFGMAGAQAGMLAYSRADEEDADLRALRTLRSAGYSGWGVVRFMDTLKRLSLAPDDLPTYLFTHPMPGDRGDLLAAQLGQTPQEPSRDDIWSFRLLQTRVLVFDPKPWGVSTAVGRADAEPNRYEAQLAAAVLLRSAGRYEEAEARLAKAEALSPARPETAHERALILVRRGKLAQAANLLEGLRADGRATIPVLRDLTWIRTEAGEPEKALVILDELAKSDPRWEELPYRRGIALGKAGRAGEGYAELGKYYEVRDPERALRHYRAALESLPPGPRADEVRAAIERTAGRVKDLPPRPEQP
jgi:predicted Zn-dependent protease